MSTPTEQLNPIEIAAKKHSRILELLGIRLTAQATIDNILDNASQKQIGHLLKCDESLRLSTEQNAAAELELEQLARDLIPDSAEKRSIETPLGTLKLTRAPAIVSAEDGGDAASIALIEDWARGELPKRNAAAFAEVAVVDPAASFIRIEKMLDREALEDLPDAALKALRLIRVRPTKFSITVKKLTAANAKALLATEKARVA